jgi:MoaA/NifB/PqqE/SkfB family radical SAM enzyme
MPFIHLHIGDSGEAKACCVANIKFGNINSSSLEEIWNGKPIQELRSKFSKGVPDKRCAHCIHIEKSGATSIREETHLNYAETNINFTQPELPIYFDIRFSNVCNLKCRTCWHGASSSWFEDAKALKTNKGKKAIIKNIYDFNTFIETAGIALIGAKEIYLAGGEPLVTEEHYLLLQWLIDKNVSSVKLRYNTNLTLLQYKGKSILDYWNKFEQVEVLVSIDAIDELASYVRANSDWTIIQENLNIISKLAHVKIKISPTISVLNIEFIPELIQRCIQLKVINEEEVYINILERPIHYNIQIFPTEIKTRIIKKLTNFQNTIQSQQLKQQIGEIIDYMKSSDKSNQWEKYTSANLALDNLRNEISPLPY